MKVCFAVGLFFLASGSFVGCGLLVNATPTYPPCIPEGLELPPPTAQPLVSSLRAYEGVRADYFRQLTLGQQAAGYQTAAQLGQNLAVPQTRGSGRPETRERTRRRLETSLTEAYQRNGPSQADAAARAAYESPGVMNQLAVLHLPDLVAGGYDTPVTLGLRSVNSSIGSQLRPDRLGEDLRAYVDSIPPEFRPTTLVNLSFQLNLP